MGGVFYEYDDDGQVLTLRPEAFDFLRRNHAVLSKAVLAEWAKFLERINPSLPMLVAKIERDEATRGQLTGYRRLYLNTMVPLLLLRGQAGAGHTHVDHLIPWSYLFDDNAWNWSWPAKPATSRRAARYPRRSSATTLIDRNRRYYGLIGEISPRWTC